MFIAAETVLPQPHVHHAQASEFLRLASEANCQVVLSNSTVIDLNNASAELKTVRLNQLRKYTVLNPVPPIPGLAEKAGFPDPISSHDRIDLDVLSVLEVGYADWLVTQDGTLLRRARRAGHAETAFSIADAVEILSTLTAQPPAVLNVDFVQGYEVDLSSGLFDGIRVDYPEFNTWWREKVVRESRPIISLGPPSYPEGLSVLKVETDRPYGLEQRVLKICTFKIYTSYSNTRRGELMLNATIDFARRQSCHEVYIEAKPDKEHLFRWLADFGFNCIEQLARNGDMVFVKRLNPTSAEYERLSSLEYHIKFGPGAIKTERAYLVPIRQTWHSMLFPESGPQRSFFSRQDPCGNAIRKVYISRSPINEIPTGSTVIFLQTRTGSRPTVSAIGVAEESRKSRDSNSIIQFAGNRTVYSADDIERICAARKALAVRFRLDRMLPSPWTLSELQSAGLLIGHAQSIQAAKSGGLEWLKSRLDESR